MKINLEKTGKKFYREWIFRNISLSFSAPEKIALLGPNGSGKSTLLQVLAGAMLPTEGKISYTLQENTLDPEFIFRHISLAAPYLELIEEFTLEEIVNFHFRFKKSMKGMKAEEIIRHSGLQAVRKKTFKFYSSGMKQRLKLTLALLSDTDMVLLDEPCSNLDQDGIRWYRDLVAQFASDKLVFVCSNNQPEEFAFCTNEINVMDWK